MATLRIRGSQIESLLPSVDARADDTNRVLNGRNFNWDSLGPKSGFDTRMLSPFPFSALRNVQGIRVQDRTLVFTEDAIMSWRNSIPYAWQMHQYFLDEIPAGSRDPWSAIYLNGYIYANQSYRGFFAAVHSTTSDDLLFTLQTSTLIPGLPSNIIAMDIVQGRAILIDSVNITWSALGTLNLVPSFGGAGQQKIAQKVKGNVIALTPFQEGFVVWTDQGAILAEYIGGDAVWRFDTLFSTERPIGQSTIIRLKNGASAFLSERGVMVIQNINGPEPLTPQFNEYFRELLKNSTSVKRKWRMEYDDRREQIFVMESTDLLSYNRSFCLHPTLNKWGLFSDRVYGFLPFTNDNYGYVDALGYQQYFLQAFNRGAVPAESEHVVPVMPQFDQTTQNASSTMVSNAFAPNYTFPVVFARAIRAAWAHPTNGYEHPGGTKAMDSWIEVGYFRPAQFQMAADNQGEQQELVLGSILSAAPNQIASDATTNWKASWFYWPLEDWGGPSTIVDTTANITEDWNATVGDEDWGSADESYEDWNLLLSHTITIPSAGAPEDWNLLSGVEDWSAPVDPVWPHIDHLNQLSHLIYLLMSEDGITFDTVNPALSRFNTGAWGYVAAAQNVFTRVRLAAMDASQYYQIRYLETTVSFTGERS